LNLVPPASIAAMSSVFIEFVCVCAIHPDEGESDEIGMDAVETWAQLADLPQSAMPLRQATASQAAESGQSTWRAGFGPRRLCYNDCESFKPRLAYISRVARLLLRV
jgi:hypothetical protein